VFNLVCGSDVRPDLKFRAWGLGFGVLGFRVWGLGFEVEVMYQRLKMPPGCSATETRV
jgi:hypothetical protein